MTRRYVVTAAAVLLIALAVGYTQKRNVDAQLARESALRLSLASMRKAITTYHGKHQRNPSSLEDLVRDGELRAIPADPITESNQSWKTTVEESVSVDDFQSGTAKAPPSVVEVHSGASGRDSSGKAFADY
jgi:general secretion pathway protein G